MKKNELRKKQKEILRAYAHTSQKIKEDQLLCEKLFTTKEIKESQKIGVTLSLPLEVDTSKIIATLWDAGKEVYLAKAYNNKERTQDFLRYTYRSKLEISRFGVKEIADQDAEINNDLDLLLVPGIAFSLKNHMRLGFGGGYYDRFIARHPQTKTISLANSKMIFKENLWQPEKTDMSIQTIVTPSQIFH